MHRYVIGLGFSLATAVIGCSGAIAPDPSAGKSSQAQEGSGATKEPPATGANDTPPATATGTAPGDKDVPPPSTSDPGDPGDKGGKGGTTAPPTTGSTCFTVTLPGCSSVVDAKTVAVAKCAGLTIASFNMGDACGGANALDISFSCCTTATADPPANGGTPPNKGCGDVPPPSGPGEPPTKPGVPTSSDPPDGVPAK